ncbi:hypothetical protein F2P56_018008 [Juglans regia]|uniref:Uncharacterized protein KIAA0930 homolog n=2 Tax=Juglans regia TaxID=51240 RepID=A0A2I4FQ83_JUGRE|nr:uncharacterized protein KIAA0930 homolog [Juglans regia]KAF5461950.1 hypothetical protein F2P56_018008 [Juglans regia]
MFGDGGEMPSRYELLSMVKKHSNSLGRTVADELPKDDASEDVEFNPRFWHDVFDLYFVLGKESRGRQDDDLLFFVRKLSSQGYGVMEAVAPYFVRRWAAKLDMVVGESSVDVDWRRSFYLNLIAHTSFTVTVAICSHQDLQNRQAGQDKPLLPIYKVVKTVYASPSRVNFHLDSKKEVETTPAYPDICFAVDDFDSTFDAMVLTETDHCFCVLLNANDGAAFPSNDANHAAKSSSEKELQDCSSSNNSSSRVDTTLTKSTKLTLFSGFVSYKMVCNAYDAGKSRFGNFLSFGHSPGKTDRLYMKGPGGRGEVEVAVSGVVDQSQQDSGPFSPVISSRRFGIGSIFRKAATVASVAAKHAYAAATATHLSSAEEMLPLKCCLMSISLPWEYIARDLLFKGTPHVNL